MYLIFTTDVNHTYKSRDLIGIATTKLKVIPLINKYIKKGSHPPLTDYDKEFLMQKLQTQNYGDYDETDFEFVLEEVTPNELI